MIDEDKFDKLSMGMNENDELVGEGLKFLFWVFVIAFIVGLSAGGIWVKATFNEVHQEK